MTRGVQYPHWRAELIQHLENIGRAQVRLKWSTAPYAARTLHHVKFVCNFIFDTMGISESPEKLIGLVFFDQVELESTKRFSESFLSVLDQNEQTDAAVLSDPNWPEVMSMANDTLRILRSRERH